MKVFLKEYSDHNKLNHWYIAIVWVLLSLTTSLLQGQEYHRIISLSPNLTNFICLLEQTDDLIGCTSYCDIPDNKGITKVATSITVSIEKVFTLNPDLVLTTTLTRPETIKKLRQLNIRVELFNTPASFDELCEQFVKVGILTGEEEMARSIIKHEKQKIKKLQTLIPANHVTPSMFFQIGSNPLFSVLSGTFMNDFITLAGARNIAEDFKKGTVSRESVILRNPDIIIISSMGMLANQEKEFWNNYSGLSAALNNKILLVDANAACSPTPVQFTEVLQEIIEFIY